MSVFQNIISRFEDLKEYMDLSSDDINKFLTPKQISYSELEVAELGKDDEWTPERIKERGLILLKFMESRWQLNMGDESKKLALLHLSFLDESSAVRAAEESALEEEPSV